MDKSGIMEEIRRINKGHKPTSDAWYCKILYGIHTLIYATVSRIKNAKKRHLKYRCPLCDKESDDYQVIFDCICGHEYNNKGNDHSGRDNDYDNKDNDHDNNDRTDDRKDQHQKLV